MRFESIVDIVRIIVGIVVDILAELNSRICCCIFGRVEFSGMVNLQGKCCRNFCRLSVGLELDYKG